MSIQPGVTAAPPSQWTLRLAAPADVALASLRSVATDDIWVVSTEGSTVTLSFRGREPAVRVVAEVRPHEAGSEVLVRRAPSLHSRDGILAALLAPFCLLAGWDIAHVAPVGYQIAVCGEIGLMVLLASWISAARRRHADVKAITEAIDRTLAPLKPGTRGATYRVPAGDEPARGEPELDFGAGSRRGRRR